VVEIYFTVLTGVAMAMALCGLDDLLVDCLYHLRRTWRSLTIYRRHPRARAESLIGQREPAAAILVPAWSEGAVIAAMLRHLHQALLYRHYRVLSAAIAMISARKQRFARSPGRMKAGSPWSIASAPARPARRTA